MRKKNLMTRALGVAMAAMMLAPATAFAAAPNETAAVSDTSTFAVDHAAPEVANVELKGDFFSNYYRLSFKGDAATYLKAVKNTENTTITINGNQVSRKSSFFGDTNSYKLSTDPAYGGDEIFIDFTEDCFKGKEASVVIKTAGYTDLKFSMKNGTLVKEESKPEIKPEVTLKKTPEAAKLDKQKDSFSSSLRLSFKGEGIEDYIKAAKKGSISINGQQLTKVSSFWNDTMSYKFSSDPAFGGGEIYIDFTEDCFKEGVSKVLIKAEGYEDLSFNVKDGAISTEKEEEATFVTAAKQVDLGWSKYIVADLEENVNFKDLTFKVDGKDITPTKVTDDGDLVKWEVSSLDHKNLTITKKDATQTIDLGGKGDAESVVSGKTTSDYFLLNGPVYVWDYHLRNFDDNGNVRVSPSKTTFDLSGKSTGGVKYYSPDAELIPDEGNHYNVKGQVELMFNYEKGTEAEKAFVDGITDVDLVAYNSNKNTINDQLEFTLDKAHAHNGSTVACISVPLGQSNFYSNGRYYLRVTSNGKGSLFPIHVVNSVAPSMTLTEDKVVTGQQDVHFRVKDMTYAITMPIYQVILTNPKGEKTELQKIDDWYLIGDLFVLYNDGKVNRLDQPGNYTLDVYADGFKPFSKTFAVSQEGELTDGASVPYDAISTASVNGGGGSSEGGSADTNVMNANLVMDTDLLVNALVLKDMGIENEFANGIVDRWNSMNKLSVYMKGSETVYDAEAYFDAVNSAKVSNKYLSFKSYIKGDSAVKTKNRPYKVKQVLEDNLLGDVTSFNESSAQSTPDMILTSSTETSATFSTEDEEYLKALKEKGTILLNSDNKELSAKDFTIDLSKKTLEVRGTKAGENNLILRVPGYQTFKLPFVCEKELQKVKLEAAGTLVGEDVTVTCTEHKGTACDYMKYVESVVVTAPDGTERVIRPLGAEGLDLGYKIQDNVLTIGGKIFTEDWATNEDGTYPTGEYSIAIENKFYPQETVKVTLKNEEKPAEQLVSPTVKNIEEKKDFLNGKYYHVSFNEDEKVVEDFLKKIDTITINKKEVKKVTGFFN